MPTDVAIFRSVYDGLATSIPAWTQLWPSTRAWLLRDVFRETWMSGRPADHWDHFAALDWVRVLNRLEAS
jgi:hypothetical protein